MSTIAAKATSASRTWSRNASAPVKYPYRWEPGEWSRCATPAQYPCWWERVVAHRSTPVDRFHTGRPPRSTPRGGNRGAPCGCPSQLPYLCGFKRWQTCHAPCSTPQGGKRGWFVLRIRTSHCLGLWRSMVADMTHTVQYPARWEPGSVVRASITVTGDRWRSPVSYQTPHPRSTRVVGTGGERPA